MSQAFKRTVAKAKPRGPSTGFGEHTDATKDAELVFGLVAPVGTDLDSYVSTLRTRLDLFGYHGKEVRLSSLLSRFGLPGVDGASEATRIDSAMTAGNAFRKLAGKGGLSWAAAAHVHTQRASSEPLRRTAHIFRSLKHPDEVLTLRRIYGAGFYLIGVVAPKAARRKFLDEEKGCSAEEITDLLRRDEDELEEHGQKTRATFHLADVFVRLEESVDTLRFLDLVFGAPFETPTIEEYAMFLAFAASLRSADLSRQVGAVITSSRGEIVATGANDVACFGGGLYWPGARDRRDYTRGCDSNQTIRDDMIVDIVSRLTKSRRKRSRAEILKQGKRQLEATGLLDITEFGRAVHAEMEALIACARSGISTRGGTLHTTTFPCHNCAKHIIAAGLRKVVYVEPYPKSQAVELYRSEICTEDDAGTSRSRVRFEAFRGVGPRRFLDLFSLQLSSGYKVQRKNKANGSAVSWSREGAAPRVPMLPNSYLDREAEAQDKLTDLTQNSETKTNEQAVAKHRRRRG
jgi:deoxycytidylate deaminase